MENLLKRALSIDDILAIAEDVNKLFGRYGPNLFLIGELGAGKTTFIQELGTLLGVREPIVSPSFQVARIYKMKGGGEFVHMDLYRLKSREDIISTGWFDFLQRDSLTAVEWADRAWGLLPEEGIFMEISIIPEGGREYRIVTRKQKLSGS